MNPPRPARLAAASTRRVDLRARQGPAHPRTPRRSHPAQPARPRPATPARAHRLRLPQPLARPPHPRARRLRRLTAARNQPSSGVMDWLDTLATDLRERLLAGAGEPGEEADVHGRIRELVDREAGVLAEDQRAGLVARIAERAFGLGPLEPLLADP